jgi:hypothetical protein
MSLWALHMELNRLIRSIIQHLGSLSDNWGPRSQFSISSNVVKIFVLLTLWNISGLTVGLPVVAIGPPVTSSVMVLWLVRVVVRGAITGILLMLTVVLQPVGKGILVTSMVDILIGAPSRKLKSLMRLLLQIVHLMEHSLLDFALNKVLDVFSHVLRNFRKIVLVQWLILPCLNVQLRLHFLFRLHLVLILLLFFFLLQSGQLLSVAA